MKLLIKQRVFSWTDTYDIYDEQNIPRYFVKAELFALGHQIHVYDKYTGDEVGSIHQKLLTFLPKFEIVIDGATRGTVQQEFSFLRPRYSVSFNGWDVEGDMAGWNYEATQYGYTVLTVHKQWFSWGDTYVLDINDPADEIPALLLVLAIDAANCDK